MCASYRVLILGLVSCLFCFAPARVAESESCPTKDQKSAQPCDADIKHCCKSAEWPCPTAAAERGGLSASDSLGSGIVENDVEHLKRELGELRSDFDSRVNQILSRMQGNLEWINLLASGVAVLGALGAFFGYRGLNRKADEALADAKDSRREARADIGQARIELQAQSRGVHEALAEARAQRAETAEAIQHVRDLRGAFDRFSERFELEVSRFPNRGLVDLRRVANVDGSNPLDPMEEATWKDLDVTVVISDWAGLEKDGKRQAEHFRILARYWLTRADYGRAIVRGRRAVYLDETNSKAHVTLAQALTFMCNDEQFATLPVRERLLHEALKNLDDAGEIEEDSRADALDARGWVLDEMGRSDEAAGVFGRAHELEVERSLRLHREVDWTSRYNQSCALSRAGRLDEALEVLQEGIQVNLKIASIERDPDLENLRSSPAHRVKFELLLDEERKRRKAEDPAGTPDS